MGEMVWWWCRCRDGMVCGYAMRWTEACTVGCTCRCVASHVTRSELLVSAGAFMLTHCNTNFVANMTASIWHAEHARCRELASPDIFNFVISV
jgi:hypothetical protein